MYQYSIEKDGSSWCVYIGEDCDFEGSELECFEFLAHHLAECVAIEKRGPTPSPYSDVYQLTEDEVVK